MADLILNLASLKAKSDAAGAATSATNTTPSLCPNKSSITDYVTDAANRVVISGSYSNNQLVKDRDVKIKSTGRVTTAPTNKNSEWTGSSISLINAGSGTGTMYYSLNGGSYSTSIPTATDVGSYTIYYYSAATSDYTQSSTGSITATIRPQTHNGYEYVDLGLPSGTKWAKFNIGSSSLTAKGNIYSWGEVTTKSSYGPGNYKYGSSMTSMSKYTSSDGKVYLDASDDAAYYNMGGSWRLPTRAQLQELKDYTTASVGSNYNGSGVNVIILTSTRNSRQLIFPPTCYYYDNTSGYCHMGWYMANERTTSYDYCCYLVELSSSDGSVALSDNARVNGFGARGVFK